MKAFLDTSVMVAAFWADHADHEASLKVLAAANPANTSCSAHSLAELYATLTKLPVRPAIPPEQVILFIEDLPRHLTLIRLDEADYLSAVRQLADRKQTGGLIYDALLLSCARKSKAKAIYTYNLKYFRELAPDLASIIRIP